MKERERDILWGDGIADRDNLELHLGINACLFGGNIEESVQRAKEVK